MQHLPMGQLNTAATLSLLNLAILLGTSALVASQLGLATLPMTMAAAATSAVVSSLLAALLTRQACPLTSTSSSLAVIYGAMAAELSAQPASTLSEVWGLLSATVIASGLLLLAAARIRLAEAVRFLPAPVSAGIMSGIGLLIAWKQLPQMLGVAGAHGSQLSTLLFHIRPGAAAVGLSAAAMALLHPRRQWPGPSVVGALAVATLLHHLLAELHSNWVGPTLGWVDLLPTQANTIGGAVGTFRAQGLVTHARVVMAYAAFLALQSVMNIAITAPATAALRGKPSDPKRALQAQGLANLLCGALGGMPVSTQMVMTMEAARKQARWQTVALSSLLLFITLVLAGPLLSMVPLAAIAGMLVASGLGLVGPWPRGLLKAAIRSGGRDREVVQNLLLVSVVAASFLMGSAPLALLVGSVLAMVLLTLSLSLSTRVSVMGGEGRSSKRVWPEAQEEWLASQRDRISIVKTSGGMFFGTADQLARALEELPREQGYCIVDMAQLTMLDATGCQLLAGGARRLQEQGTKVLLAGLDPASPQARSLRALGLHSPNPSQWLEDVDHALEWAELDLLQSSGPPPGGEAVLAGSTLARGLDARELEKLLALLERREVGEGQLCAQGERASSMFLVLEGSVEVRVRNETTGQPVRLASFGPGSLFGEIAALSTGRRTAEVWCTEPSVLLEFERARLDALGEWDPPMQAKLLRNLCSHLAQRLVAATPGVAPPE